MRADSNIVLGRKFRKSYDNISYDKINCGVIPCSVHVRPIDKQKRELTDVYNPLS